MGLHVDLYVFFVMQYMYIFKILSSLKPRKVTFLLLITVVHVQLVQGYKYLSVMSLQAIKTDFLDWSSKLCSFTFHSSLGYFVLILYLC